MRGLWTRSRSNITAHNLERLPLKNGKIPILAEPWLFNSLADAILKRRCFRNAGLLFCRFSADFAQTGGELKRYE
jgi:hypothetical protein